MVESDDHDARLTAILKAACDPTRRRILTLLVREGPMRVTDLARNFEMSLNAVSKHIKVLESAGLVGRMTQWREHVIRPELDRLTEIDRWFKDLRWVWETRLELLEQALGADDD
jgi:DNA-binding transcriptional ArsR family regulator